MLNTLAFLTEEPTYSPLILGLIGLAGLITGSYFNVVIYRKCAQYEGADPKELNTSKPKRSFCPSCKKTLSWSENIPLISYLIQGGKCTGCKSNISPVYPTVEAASTAIALIAWTTRPTINQALGLWALLALLLICGMIDAKTQKIPNALTLPGAAFLLILACLPGGIGWQTALIGGAGTYGLMFALVHLGKGLFGKRKVTLKDPMEAEWKNGGLTLRDEGKTLEESETLTGADLPFLRESDKIIMEGNFEINQSEKVTTAIITPKTTDHIKGFLKTITYPREAMGMGDAKLLLMAGAGAGFLPAINGLAAGAVAAIIATMIWRFYAKFQKQNAPELIAFGPWIAAGCIYSILFWPF